MLTPLGVYTGENLPINVCYFLKGLRVLAGKGRGDGRVELLEVEFIPAALCIKPHRGPDPTGTPQGSVDHAQEIAVEFLLFDDFGRFELVFCRRAAIAQFAREDVGGRLLPELPIFFIHVLVVNVAVGLLEVGHLPLEVGCELGVMRRDNDRLILWFDDAGEHPVEGIVIRRSGSGRTCGRGSGRRSPSGQERPCTRRRCGRR